MTPVAEKLLAEARLAAEKANAKTKRKDKDRIPPVLLANVEAVAAVLPGDVPAPNSVDTYDRTIRADWYRRPSRPVGEPIALRLTWDQYGNVYYELDADGSGGRGARVVGRLSISADEVRRIFRSAGIGEGITLKDPILLPVTRKLIACVAGFNQDGTIWRSWSPVVAIERVFYHDGTHHDRMLVPSADNPLLFLISTREMLSEFDRYSCRVSRLYDLDTISGGIQQAIKYLDAAVEKHRPPKPKPAPQPPDPDTFRSGTPPPP
jgi:hypothetical protein